MSQTKKFKLQIILVLMLVCFFMAGCKNETPVEDIYFNLNSGEQIVLFVGQTLDLNEYVVVRPSYATNKKFNVTSFNEDVVQVQGTTLIALKEDQALIKVSLKDNPLKECMMTVVVKATQEQLNAPLNLTYDRNTQMFNFDAVTYASSYTIKVNGEEFDLGNSTSFALSQYKGKKYDNLIVAQVKANAPAYSFALKTSTYSDEYKIYQAGSVSNLRVEGGLVKFNKHSTANKHNVYLGDDLLQAGLANDYMSIKALDEKFAGQALNVKVETVVTNEIKQQYGADVHYFNSLAQSVAVNVLDIPEIQLSSTVLSWQNIAHSAGYSILIDGTKKTEVKTNFFDLKSLNDFEFAITSTKAHEIKVVPILANNSVSVAQTVKENSIKVQRLGLAEIMCNGENVTWSADENASVYSIKLTGEDVNLVSSTNQTSFSMANYDAGLYTIEIVAVAQVEPDVNDVYYLSSKVAVKNFGKYETLNARIENYVLNIEKLGAGTVQLDFDNDEFDKTESGTGLAVTSVDLSQYEFEAGAHSITLTRLGNLDYINSDSVSVEFSQLENIENISIANGVASVVRTELNNDAVIKLVTSGGSLVNDIEIANTGYVYNTENPQKENYLAAGEYVTKVYVEGDGSSTFSYRENGVLVACEEVGFEVLKAPTAEILNTAESKLSIETINNAEYFDVYKVEVDHNEFTRSIETNEFTFILDEGSVTYCMKSIGNGETHLTSAMSAPVTITRIETPELQYNNATNVIRKTTVDNAIDYVFAHNGEVKPYNFTSEFTEFADEITGNVFTLYAVANRGGEGQYYLNSNTYRLTLTQISNSATISLSGLDNNITISPSGHAEKFNLVVEFDFGGAKQTFTTKIDEESGVEVLSNGLEGVNEVVLNYSYSARRYVIQLLDENHNAIIDDMNNEFSVRVRFVKPSTGTDALINSELSESATLNLNRIDGVTEISVNTRNQIVLSPTNHNQEFALVCVVMISDSFGYVLESNGINQLVCNKTIQVVGGTETIGENANPFVVNYQYQAGKYYIDILDENHSLTLPDVVMSDGANISIKVKYSFAHFGVGTDLDSEFSESKTIAIQPIATIAREGQTLKIKNIKETYTYLNYSLLINNYPIQLDSTAVSVDGFIVFDVEYIYQRTPASNIQEVNTVEVVVKNNETTTENPVIATKGGKVLIKKTESVEMSSYKFNNNEDGKQNNSLAVTFNTYETEYAKTYIVEIQHGGEMIFDRIFQDSDAVDGVIEFRLDDIIELREISGRINIFTYILANSSVVIDSQTVEIFNSALSNSLILNKVDAPTNLKVSNNILSFNSVPNCVGYEIYKQTGVGYNKVNTALLTTNSYDISAIEGGTALVVKAISVVGGYTNSSYSEPINVNKLAQPTVSVENGKFKIKFNISLLSLFYNDKIEIIPEITNGARKVSININNVDGSDIVFDLMSTSLIIEPYLLMAYNNASLQAETLTLVLRAEQTEAIDGVYYLNTNPVSVDCYGLFAPTNIKKTTQENDSVELISWTENDKNKLGGNALSVGYVLKVEYLGSNIPYYSSDPKLKYFDKNSNSYVSYPSVITETSAIFPAGYGLNDDGTLQIPFGAGEYKVSVQAVPSGTVDGYNLMNSKYSETCDFEIMEAPVLSVVDGKVVWNSKEKADHYIVSIYQQNAATPMLVEENIKTTSYDFTNATLNNEVGVYKVTIKAISTREDVLNSAFSEPYYVYRLPSATDVSIDDGKLILKSTPFFTSAQIELKDKTGEKIYTYTLTNSAFEDNLAGLLIEDWENFTRYNYVNAPVQFEVNIHGQLNIVSGAEYNVGVKLFGNSSSTLGMINSIKKDNLSNLTLNKLKPNVTNVSLGVMKIMPDENYATISEEGVYTPSINVNYNFNEAGVRDFWNTTSIYKIIIKSAVGETPIYAVDFYSVITAINEGILTTDDYILMNGSYGLHSCLKYKYLSGATEKTLYFNVYQDNEFNLRDYEALYYYQISETVNHGVSQFDCLDEYKILDLAQGGSFSVDVFMLGGDSVITDETLQTRYGYITSQSISSKTFVRYGVNQLSSLDGKVQFNNLIVLVEGKEVDYPVYKLVAGASGGGNEKTFYFYHTTESDAKIIAERHDPENFNKAIYLKAEINERTNSILFDMSQYFDAGTYVATIRTLAGLGTGVRDEQDYLLNAQNPTIEYTFQKLSDTAFVFNDGVMEFEQSYIVKDGKKVYYQDYEITLIDNSSNTTYVYKINEESEGLTIDSARHYVKYVLPKDLTVLTSEGYVTIASVGGQQFSIKVRALAVDSYIINGTYKKDVGEDVMFTFEKSIGIGEAAAEKLRVENGVLKWVIKDENCHETIIKVSFVDENTKTQTIIITVGDLNRYEIEGVYQYHFYEFTDAKYNLTSSGSVQIKDGFNYRITACTKGVINNSRNILNSNFSTEINTERLSAVEAANIKTENGILTWNNISNADHYEVYLSGEESYKFITSIPQLDCLQEGYNIAVGSYSIQIKAIGSIKLNSMMSTYNGATEFIKLDTVDYRSVEIQDNKIVWSAVENADKYRVVFNYTDVSGKAQTIDRNDIEQTEFEVPNGTKGKFTINISAISVGDGKEFNGDMMAEPFTSSNDTPVQVENFEFDDQNNRLMIDVKTSNFLSGDKLLIIYNFAEYTNSGIKEAVLEQEEISYLQDGRYGKIDAETYRYYYPLATMGVYSSISVQVARPGTVPSNAVSTNDIDLHLFKYGAGTLDNPETVENEYNPYRIETVEQLLNIAHCPSAHYELISSIDMSSVNIQERLNSFGGVIAQEFKGSINGNEFALLNFNSNGETDKIELEKVASFALFNSLNGAIIKNLVIGAPNIQLILSNMFASSTANVINLSLIATGATSSTLDNIQVLDFKILLESNNNAQLQGELFLSGLIGNATYCVIQNSTVNFSVEINVATTNSVYVGGVVAKAHDSTVENCEIDFALTASKDNTLTYVGGAIAYFEGDETQTTGIFNSSAAVAIDNIKSTYIGGLVGFARHIKILESSTSGTYSKANINYATNVGGIVGLSQNSIFKDSGSTMNIIANVNSIEDKYFGAIAGRLTIVQNSNAVSYVENCYMAESYRDETQLTTSSITLGIYGNKNTAVSITGCYKLEN